MKTVLKVALGIGAFGVFVVIVMEIVLWATAGITNVAREQIAMISAGQVEEAYEKYSSVDFKKETSLETFENFVKVNAQLSDNVNSKFYSRHISVEGENGIGTLEGTLTDKAGSIAKVKYTFVKEGEDWKILNMEF